MYASAKVTRFSGLNYIGDMCCINCRIQKARALAPYTGRPQIAMGRLIRNFDQYLQIVAIYDPRPPLAFVGVFEAALRALF